MYGNLVVTHTPDWELLPVTRTHAMNFVCSTYFPQAQRSSGADGGVACFATKSRFRRKCDKASAFSSHEQVAGKVPPTEKKKENCAVKFGSTDVDVDDWK